MAVIAGNGLDGDLLRLALMASGTALVLLVAAIAGWWTDGAWVAQGMLGLLYLAVVAVRGPELDTTAPAVAAALLLTGELAVLARTLLDGSLLDPRELGRRLLLLGLVGLGAVAAGWLLLAASAVGVPGGMLTTALGAVAVVGAVAVLLAVARDPGR